jgi:hypothetical protein
MQLVLRPRARAPRSHLAVALAVGSLISAPAARAGGDFLDLAAGSGRVWVVGAAGVNTLDARSGRTLAKPALIRASYPLSVALAGGGAWIASVENGYVWGTLSRIDMRTGRTRVLWRRRDSSVQYVAGGAGGVYALIGSAHGMRIARFALDGRLEHIWQVPGAGRIAADDSGCWITAEGRLIHIDPAGRLHRVLSAPLGSIAVGAGAVWVSGATSVLRVDERTGQVRRIRTGHLAVGGFQHDLAVRGNALWVLVHPLNGERASTLLRIDARSGRTTGRVAVPGIANAVVIRQDAVWVATVMAPTSAVATGYAALRFDPRTLRRTLLAQVG